MHFLFCKTKIPAVFNIGNRIGDNIVQASEDAFFGDAQAAGQDGKFQASIGLEYLAKQVPYQMQHLVIVTLFKCLCQWHIVFVNQDNGFLAIVFTKKPCQAAQAGINICIIHIFCQKSRQRFLFFLAKHFPVHPFFLTHCFFLYRFYKHPACGRIRVGTDIL